MPCLFMLKAAEIAISKGQSGTTLAEQSHHHHSGYCITTYTCSLHSPPEGDAGYNGTPSHPEIGTTVIELINYVEHFLMSLVYLISV